MHIGKKVTLAGFKKAYEHLLQKSARHKKDVRLSDPLSERKSVMEDMNFDPVFRHAENFEELKSYAEERSVSPGGYQRKLVGIRFIFSPPDTSQALLHALPATERRDMLNELTNAYDHLLEATFGTQPRVTAVHTDKVRLHIETIILKFQQDKTAHPAFKGISRRHTHNTARAVTAAQFGGRWNSTSFHSRMAHAMTSIVIDKIRWRYMSNYNLADDLVADPKVEGRDACIRRIAIASEYLDFLSIATTDETLAKRDKGGQARMPEFPFRCYLDAEVPDPKPVENPPNFLLRARMRVLQILSRREREMKWRLRALSRIGRIKLFALARRKTDSKVCLDDPKMDTMAIAARKEIRRANLMRRVENRLTYRPSRTIRELLLGILSSFEKDPAPVEEVFPAAENPELLGTTKESISLPSPPVEIPPSKVSEGPESRKVPSQIGISKDPHAVEAPPIPTDPLFGEWLKDYKPTPTEHEMMREEGGFEKFLAIRAKEFEERKKEILAELRKNKQPAPRTDPEM